MSDSAKLRFVYGLITYILSFLDLVAILVLSFLVGFKKIHKDFTVLIFILAVLLCVLFITTLVNFTQLYSIGIEEKEKK